MTVSKHWCNLDDTNEHEDHMNLMFTNHGEEEDIYSLTTIEIAQEQKKDQSLKIYHKKDDMTSMKIIVPKSLMTHTCCAKMISQSSPYLYSTGLSVGTIIVSNTLP